MLVQLGQGQEIEPRDEEVRVAQNRCILPERRRQEPAGNGDDAPEFLQRFQRLKATGRARQQRSRDRTDRDPGDDVGCECPILVEPARRPELVGAERPAALQHQSRPRFARHFTLHGSIAAMQQLIWRNGPAASETGYGKRDKLTVPARLGCTL